jgi:DNA-binding Lrp family transcriptional regulator
MTRAYLLVKTELGKAPEVQAALRGRPGIVWADIVTGDYDLVVIAEGPNAQELGRLVMRDVQGIPGITAIATYVVVG